MKTLKYRTEEIGIFVKDQNYAYTYQQNDVLNKLASEGWKISEIMRQGDVVFGILVKESSS